MSSLFLSPCGRAAQRLLVWTLAVFVAFMIAGCQNATDGRAVMQVPVTPVNIDDAKRPLAAGDVLDVRIEGEDDISRTYTLDSNGRADLPLVGAVSLAGLDTVAAADAIASVYRGGYLVDPKVRVVRKTPRPVYVLGDVLHAGSQDWQAGTRVSAVVLAAGRDRSDAVYTVIRGGRATNVKPDDVLQPGDVVVVRAVRP